MTEIEGCNFPDEGILYDVDDQIWVRFDDDGNITCGLTDIAQHIAGNVLYLRPQKIGSDVKKGKRMAILESGKYVGPINAPLSGKIIEVNQRVIDGAGIVNDDCYGTGWVLRIKPDRLEEEKGSLMSGPEAMEAISEKMARESWDCLK